ncbi:mechanosensitive ion channel family protein [Zobellia laminariae]|uniref:mechanosensitive ion channel family protein n=1 Tax=Zobellia laminariae TaxID=248906 RepID=UPI0012D94BDD|nr:mechanosensitive ion channel domain-containing protein [Zobellia laminariae]MUH38576.1 mechanosensitive ion channel protein MscS [Zobellia laminariae]WKX74912.1 mechanosensitive ion channel [Zobellia laminariae]
MIQETQSKVEEILEVGLWQGVKDFLNLGLRYGEGENSINITIGLLLLVTVVFLITGFVLKWLRILLTQRMEAEDKLKFVSVFKFIRYLVYVVVILLTMSAAGIDITLLLTASAALFVGLGLALQELFQDVIGGIFIIIDKSLHVGDIIEIDSKVGKVFEIKLRTTRAITRDDKVIIIPNHKFISDIIYNYTQNHKTTREQIKIGIAYGSDINLATKILETLAGGQKGILKSPKPFVIFEDFGDSALLFTLNFYTIDSFNVTRVKSEMRYKLDAEFRKNNISIPFPQRDIHIIQQKPFQHSNTNNIEAK